MLAPADKPARKRAPVDPEISSIPPKRINASRKQNGNILISYIIRKLIDNVYFLTFINLFQMNLKEIVR